MGYLTVTFDRPPMGVYGVTMTFLGRGKSDCWFKCVDIVSALSASDGEPLTIVDYSYSIFPPHRGGEEPLPLYNEQ